VFQNLSINLTTEAQLRVFERKVMRKIYGQIKSHMDAGDEELMRK
jgi:hypothetical protein